jgi:hypothetical protein
MKPNRPWYFIEVMTTIHYIHGHATAVIIATTHMNKPIVTVHHKLFVVIQLIRNDISFNVEFILLSVYVGLQTKIVQTHQCIHQRNYLPHCNVAVKSHSQATPTCRKHTKCTLNPNSQLRVEEVVVVLVLLFKLPAALV